MCFVEWGIVHIDFRTVFVFAFLGKSLRVQVVPVFCFAGIADIGQLHQSRCECELFQVRGIFTL